VVLTASGEARGWQGSYGRTQLAVALAQSLWESGQVNLVVWITATDRSAILSGYVRAAVDAMGITPTDDAEAVTARFLHWLARSGRPWLVVLDDLTDPADLEGLWPGGPTGRVLITSPRPVEGPGGAEIPVFPVGAFSLREAMNYLVSRLTAGPHLRTGAFGLIEDLGGEPLALAHACSVIKSSGISCDDYRENVARKRQQNAAATGSLLPPAAVTWSYSLEYAEVLTPGAQFLLLFAALLDGHGIPAPVFTTKAVYEYLAGIGATTLAEAEGTRAALLSLDRVGLLHIDTSVSPPTVRVSPVVQGAIRSVMPGRTVTRAVRAAADALLQVWPAEEAHAGTADALRACAERLRWVAGDLLWKGTCHPVLLRVGDSLIGARLSGPAVAYWNDLSTTAEKLLAPGHPDILTTRDRLATALLGAGRPAEAAQWFQQSLGMWLRSAGPDHPAAVMARIGLGRALVAAGQPADGVGVLSEAVAECERVFGPEHPETLTTRDRLADAHRAAGRPADAAGAYRRTLADRERIQGQRHPDVMAIRQKLGEVYLVDGKAKDAASCFKRALADRERVLGSTHPDTIASRAGLGSAHSASGRMASAVRMLEEASMDSDRVLGEDHPASLERAVDYAHTLYAVGRISDATSLLREVASRCDRFLPPDAPLRRVVAESLANIAGK
jgi:tetratricopeptide (TPR) repeat protein